MKKQYFLRMIFFSLFILATVSGLRAQSNQYLDFDGTNDWVSVPNASTLVVGLTSFSMTGWFYDNLLSYGQGMMGFRSGTEGFYMIQLNNGQIECRFSNSAGTLYEVVAPAGTTVPLTWQHYAWVYDGTSVKLYLNGNLVGSKAATGTFALGTTPFAIGKSPLGSFNFYYNGRIDEVSVWGKGLTQAEVQDVMNNEITTPATGLLLYYKFNQGVPGGNNTGITKLVTDVNSPTYDGDITNFAMTGSTSNFNGTVNTGFQAISFPQIPTKLTSSPAFALHATATSGLPVGFEVLSGPATLSNDSILTLTGAGTVSIKAYQYGDMVYDTATPVINTFAVVDPTANTPVTEVRHPLAGDVFMPTLDEIQLAALVSIPYPELFSVQSVEFKINGQTIPAHDFGNGHYTAWWLPPSYGNHTIEIHATNNFGAVSVTPVAVNIVSTQSDVTVTAFSSVLINVDVSSVTVDGNLPSYLGAYDTIIATLTVSCPTGGCGEWDHIASVEAKSHEGNWFEIIRYITPYKKACSHKINLADYMSLLNGKVTFRVSCGTLDNGYLYALSFQFKSGQPPHKYSQVNQVWRGDYPFGDYANLQPVPDYNFAYPPTTVASRLKLISTGHGWGTLNTGNAAEFYDATHNIWVNGANTFSQHNWTTCNPNPDGCSPQSGTWTYSRAGWCPGAIARPFDYDMSPFIAPNNVQLRYRLYSSYMDQCHPNNPNCVTGTTCTDCNDGFNPYLDMACNLVNFFDTIPPIPTIQSVAEATAKYGISIYPNPSSGMFNLIANNAEGREFHVSVFDLMGHLIKEFDWNGEARVMNLKGSPKGVYMVRISNKEIMDFRKIVIN